MEKGIDYPGVTVVFFCHDGQGNYVLAKRGKNCRDEHGCWDPGGGGVEHGAGVEETLRKEVAEEYCTDILEHEFLGYHDIFREIEGKRTHWIALTFKVLVDKDKVANGEPHKFDAVEWFRMDNLPNPPHSQWNLVVNAYKDKLL
ncbi:MAG: NUDIX domain-containing protein [Candidatus Paceibacterota bacterium]